MHEQKLHKQLLANYTKTTRPLVDHRNAVTVELGLALIQIGDLVGFNLYNIRGLTLFNC